MPLLTTTEKTNARIAELGQNVAAHLSAAATACNRMVAESLALSDADLTAWLNSRSAQEVTALFSAHGLLGVCVNDAQETCNAMLQESGLDASSVQVDIRPVPEKLAAMSRSITVVDGNYVVTTNPPPEPEPTPDEPTPDPVPE